MNIINLSPYLLGIIVSIILFRVCVFILDVTCVNELLGLDRERKKVAEKLKLSLTSDKDRERINKKIALYNLVAIVYIGLTYFILILGITEWLN